jgi:hypothetical protein
VVEFVRSPDDRQAAALLHGVTLTGTAILFNSLWLYATRRSRLLRDDADPREVRGITRSFLPRAPSYAGATLIALLSPIWSVAAFAAIAVFYMLSSTIFGRA